MQLTIKVDVVTLSPSKHENNLNAIITKTIPSTLKLVAMVLLSAFIFLAAAATPSRGFAPPTPRHTFFRDVIRRRSPPPPSPLGIYIPRGGTKTTTPAAVSTTTTTASSSLSSSNPPNHNLVTLHFGGLPYRTAATPSAHRVLFVLGGPGAGKGTQSALLTTRFPPRSVVHFSVGDLLREARAAGGPDAQLIESYIVAGKIVPVEVSLGLLKSAMDEVDCGGGGAVFLVDGFPRSMDNLEGFERVMRECGALLGAVVLECPVEQLEERILERAKTSGRSDDNLESMRKRFVTFEKETMPVVKHLTDSERCPVHYIDGSANVENVWNDTSGIVKDILISDVISANAQLINAIAAADWTRFARLVDKDMLALTDNRSEGDEVDVSAYAALEGGVIDDDDGLRRREIAVSEASVTLESNVAVVKYVREDIFDGGKERVRVEETRTWEFREGRWVNVHFSRVPRME